MQLNSDRLPAHLERELRPIYIVSGDEPLQLGECADLIRRNARARGFEERIVMTVDAGFDWSELGAQADSLSLFAERRLLELRLPSGKPGDAGAKAFVAYAARPHADTVLLVSTGKLAPQARRSKWYTTLEKAGVAVQVWPVERQRLSAWVGARARALGLALSVPAAELLAERVEGNLMAAAQELDKLRLLYGGDTVDLPQVLSAVADSARFDVFDLVDLALAGDHRRSVRTLRGLREEGVEQTLVLWALTRELRSLATISRELKSGRATEQVFAAHRIWDKRKPSVRSALGRHGVEDWLEMLRVAAQVERLVKSSARDKAWDALERLSLRIAGLVVFPEQAEQPAVW